MKRASITETKNSLSALIARVKQGETVLIMERGQPVAKLTPVVAMNLDHEDQARLARLERAGIIKRARSAPDMKLLEEPPPKLPSGVSVLQALLEEREEAP
jgi:prevent-host-death family protein